jgi:hypothetical protein
MAKLLLLPSVAFSEPSYKPYAVSKMHCSMAYGAYQKAKSAMTAAPPIVPPTIPPTLKSAHAVRKIQREWKTYQ